MLQNRRYNDYNKARTAFFYYFDTVDDGDVVRGLVDAAATWARARGLEVLKGPKGMLRADAYGVLVEGFEHPAGMGIPYNYPYYARLLEQVGMEKEIDYVSGYVTPDQQLPERLFRTVERLKERGGLWVKSFTSKRELRAWIPRIQRVNNEAFTQVWGYYPIDDEEVHMIGQQMLLAADPRLLKVVMKGDDIAGFCFVFPDIAETLRATGGQLWPFGWIRLLIGLKTTKRLLANGVGLLPQYQGLGGSAMMYAELERMIRAQGHVCRVRPGNGDQCQEPGRRQHDGRQLAQASPGLPPDTVGEDRSRIPRSVRSHHPNVSEIRAYPWKSVILFGGRRWSNRHNAFHA